MKTTNARYKVKSDRVEENIRYSTYVFEQLKKGAPPGLRYVSFHLGDGVSFLHMAILDDDITENLLPQMKVFQPLVSQIGNRCDEPPAAISATVVGAYRMFEGSFLFSRSSSSVIRL